MKPKENNGASIHTMLKESIESTFGNPDSFSTSTHEGLEVQQSIKLKLDMMIETYSYPRDLKDILISRRYEQVSESGQLIVLICRDGTYAEAKGTIYSTNGHLSIPERMADLLTKDATTYAQPFEKYIDTLIIKVQSNINGVAKDHYKAIKDILEKYKEEGILFDVKREKGRKS